MRIAFNFYSTSKGLLASQRRIFGRSPRNFISRQLSFTADASGVTVQGASFPYTWLRDSCQCSSCIDPSTSQRLHRTSDFNLNTSPSSDGIEATDEGIHIEWATGHKSFYAASFLERHSSPSKLSASHKDVPRIPWDVSLLTRAHDLYIPYVALQSPSGLLAAITQLTQYGLLFVTGVPTTETSNETCESRNLAKHFGEIRDTFYGLLWDVKNIRNSRNIAYTNLYLGPHIDLQYFDHPPRYQILHCLRNRVLGGKSIFVDGIHAANVLRKTNKSAFDLLTSTPVEFHYVNDGHHLHRSHYTIELAPGHSLTQDQAISSINYSPPFQAPLSLSTTPAEFYPALAEFTSLISKPEATFEYLLKEGDAVLFDNRRVLHARTAFYDKDDEKGVKDGETNRWLKGCYIEGDTLLDRGRVLRAKAEQGEL